MPRLKQDRTQQMPQLKLDKMPHNRAKTLQTKLLKTHKTEVVQRREDMDQHLTLLEDGEAQTHGEDIPPQHLHVLHQLLDGQINHLLDHLKEDGD